MKLKYLFVGLISSAFLLPSCVEVDEINHQDGLGVQQLTVKGYLVSDPNTQYNSKIDPEAGTITVQVPYYISDVDPIMGDLTQMKLEASMPTGYSFSPSLSGIHDLSAGYRTNLLDDRGNSQSFTIYAEAVKSSEARILSAKLVESERTAVVIREPETAGTHGKVVVAKTSSSIDGALHDVALTVSPWSTVTSSALDEETGYFDFSNTPEITVVSQDGQNKTVYDVEIQVPDILSYGAGFISSMWAKQLYTDNDEGWEAGANTSLAVVDDYLIVSNANDFKNMLVFDRFNGKRLNDVKVNCDGIPEGRKIFAIGHDQANHMVAATFTSSLWEITDPVVLIYVWKDGITSKPTPVLNANKAGSYFTAVPSASGDIDLFENFSCAGDMTSGNAVITNVFRGHYGGVMLLPFVDGKPDGNCIYEGNAGVYASTWDSSNAVPLTTTAPWSYIVHSGNGRGVVSYVPAGTGSRSITFDKPASHWWGAGQPTANWSGATLGIDYIEFNGLYLLAAINGSTGDGVPTSNRLYVADISANPSASSFSDGFLFDSREGNKIGDANNGGPAGTGYGVSGMTSKYSYENGKTVLGDDFASLNRAMGSVRFARSSDGNAVQVYMLVPDHGIIAYEITRYDI